MAISPLAGQPVSDSMLVDVSKLLAAYHDERPDPANPAERVAFGTSGHRGTAFERSFNEWHILAVTQAIAEHRAAGRIDGPLFIGIDTHALSRPAFETALGVLAANSVDVMIAEGSDYTPTPAVSHAILTYNRGRERGLADGIVITPSHNPPEDGGIKYNPPHGGPAESRITGVIQQRANELLERGADGIPRLAFDAALRAGTTHRYNFIEAYVGDLGHVIDMDVIRAEGIAVGVDPLGGAGTHFWQPIADRYRLNLTVVRGVIDPTFRFMTLDWDGRIRMDPSSPYAMRSLIALKDRFDVALACDTDHDRHGIVTRGAGLMPANHYLAASVHYLFGNRSGWRADAAVGKTVVSSGIIDRVAAACGRRVYEVPVGFKWFVDGLLKGDLGFGGEESAGASFLRQDGTVWSTDKDGMIAGLLAAEMTARIGRDPAAIYEAIASELGRPEYERIDAPATAAQKATLAALTASSIHASELVGEPIRKVLTRAPGDGSPIGGVKVTADSGWFAARPSGTEDIYKIYAESFRGRDHLARIQREAQAIIADAFAAARAPAPPAPR